jgi:hypothetical protein
MKSGKLVALAATAVLALTGCAGGSPQVAAYVGDAQISQAQVDRVTRVLADNAADSSTTLVRSRVVQLGILAEIAKRAAPKASITVTQEQRQQVIDANPGMEDLLVNPDTKDFAADFLNTAVVLSDPAGNAAAMEVVEQTTITVNPRFGVWDQQQLALVEGSSGSLSELAPLKQE